MIQERYQYWTKDGVQWTKWFNASSGLSINDLKAQAKHTEKVTKLKFEFQTV